ncbi:MAG TPA: Lrp/AsnC family transcriptional regulator [candidate division Zixibacteria bacterium]|nr:Lrp/AsnC family transcriptional regulator [candidate division Zixibacteria bacterium]
MLKDVELRLISELMKNSRRSDRELAKALGISQPTVSRLISRLQKEGVIKEYTMVPDFCKLGFNLMAIVMFRLKPISPTEIKELYGAAHELENRRRYPYLLVMDGMGLGKELVVISFHRDYGEYDNYMRGVKEAASLRMKAYVNTKDIESFLIDLSYKDHYQPITFSKMAAHLRTNENKKKE